MQFPWATRCKIRFVGAMPSILNVARRSMQIECDDLFGRPIGRRIRSSRLLKHGKNSSRSLVRVESGFDLLLPSRRGLSDVSRDSHLWGRRLVLTTARFSSATGNRVSPKPKVRLPWPKHGRSSAIKVMSGIVIMALWTWPKKLPVAIACGPYHGGCIVGRCGLRWSAMPFR